jgi:CNT family concentrative nucleoside transporter
MMERMISLLGLGVFVGMGYLFSTNRRAIPWHTVLWGIGLQLILAIFILRTKVGLVLFQFLGDRINTFLNYADAGSKFVFGDNFSEHFMAFKVLPTIVFFSSFISLLFLVLDANAKNRFNFSAILSDFSVVKSIR